MNAGDGEAGTFTLLQATEHSVNTVFAQVISQLGPRTVRRDGLPAGHPLRPAGRLRHHARIVAVNPLEMTNAYATIADHGRGTGRRPLFR